MRKSILAVVLAATLLGGCGIHDITIDEPDTTEQETVDDYTYEYLQQKYPDKQVVRWVTNSMGAQRGEVVMRLNEMLVSDGSSSVVFIETIDDKKYESEMNSLISSPSPPDIISAGIGEAGTLQGTERAYKNNWLMNLDDLKNCDAYDSLLSAVPDIMWQASMVNGQRLGICTSLLLSTDYVFVVNKRLMDKYKLSVEDFEGRDVTQLTDILCLLDEDDVCALDLNSTETLYRPVKGIYSWKDLRNAPNNVIGYSVDDEKGVHNLFKDDTVIDYFECVAEYRDKGYLKDSERKYKDVFITIDEISAFSTDFAYYINEVVAKKWGTNGEYEVIPFERLAMTSYNNSITGICTNSKQKEAALDVMARIYNSREMSEILIYGIEGVNFFTENNMIKNEIFSVKDMYYGNVLKCRPYINSVSDRTELLESLKPSVALGVYADLTEYKQELENMEKIVRRYEGLFYGEYDDINGTLNEINAELSDAGADRVIEYINSVMDR